VLGVGFRTLNYMVNSTLNYIVISMVNSSGSPLPPKP